MVMRYRGWLRRLLIGVVLVGLGTTLALGVTLARLTERVATSAERPWRPSGGTLLIVGGGRTPDEVHDRFVELAGGPQARIVVITTASDHPDGPIVIEGWTKHPVAWVQRLHARSREEAEDPTTVQRLREATGVWINGGDQDRLAAVYPGTAVERALQALLARGGVIGGTSAGASVMSRVMMARGLFDARLGKGMDLLPGVVIDQHFLRRNRLRRLTQALSQHPELIGIGIDEQTALLFDVSAGRGRVLGRSYVVVCIPGPDQSSPRLEFLKPGDEAGLDAIKLHGSQAISVAIDVDAFQ